MPFEHNFPNFEKVELKIVPNGIQNRYKHTNPIIDPFKFWKKLRVTKHVFSLQARSTMDPKHEQIPKPKHIQNWSLNPHTHFPT